MSRGFAHEGASLPGVAFSTWSLGARRLRQELLGPVTSADTSWYILLDLYKAFALNEKIQITSLSPIVGAPHSTAGRLTRLLIDSGMIDRFDDPTDRRRTYVELSPAGVTAMTDYFLALSGKGEPPRLIADR